MPAHGSNRPGEYCTTWSMYREVWHCTHSCCARDQLDASFLAGIKEELAAIEENEKNIQALSQVFRYYTKYAKQLSQAMHPLAGHLALCGFTWMHMGLCGFPLICINLHEFHENSHGIILTYVFYVDLHWLA